MARRYTREEFEKVFNHMFGELLPGATAQGINEVSTSQRYTIGSRMQLGERVYRYARAGSTLHNKWLAKNALKQYIHQAPLAATSPIGAMTISVTVGANDGKRMNDPLAVPDGSIAVDELAGGYLCAQTRLEQALRGYLVQRKILHNTLVAAPGGLMVITVDIPLSYALTHGADAYVDCMPSPYANVRTANPPLDGFNAPYSSAVGAPTMSALVDEYLWLQTWGPYVPQADIDINGHEDREMVAGPDGNLHMIDTANGFGSVGREKVGYILASSNEGPPGRGAPWVYLQLAP